MLSQVGFLPRGCHQIIDSNVSRLDSNWCLMRIFLMEQFGSPFVDGKRVEQCIWCFINRKSASCVLFSKRDLLFL